MSFVHVLCVVFGMYFLACVLCFFALCSCFAVCCVLCVRCLVCVVSVSFCSVYICVL